MQNSEYGERLADDVPNGRLLRLPDARHFVMWDRPEEVIDALQAFLQSG